MSRHHITKLDAARGLAAIVVLAGHAIQVFVPGPAVLSGNLARHAVLVFFLLSGYLITRSILANIGRTPEFSVPEYLVARVTRIYPPLIGAVLLTVAVGWLIQVGHLKGAYDDGAVRQAYSAPVSEAIKALVMAGGLLDANGPLWTLYIEVHLYLVAMLLALAVCRRSLVWGTAAAVLLAYHAQEQVEFALFTAVWGLGAVAALFPSHMRGVRWLGWAAAVGLAGVGCWQPGWLDFRSLTLGGPIQLAFALAYLSVVILSGPWQAPRSIVWTAGFSYTLYVVHFPLLLLGLSLGGKGWPGAMAGAAGALVVAIGLARVLEDQARFKPAIRRALQPQALRSPPATVAPCPSIAPAVPTPPPTPVDS